MDTISSDYRGLKKRITAIQKAYEGDPSHIPGILRSDASQLQGGPHRVNDISASPQATSLHSATSTARSDTYLTAAHATDVGGKSTGLANPTASPTPHTAQSHPATTRTFTTPNAKKILRRATRSTPVGTLHTVLQITR